MLNALRLTAGFEARLFTARTGLAWESIRAALGRRRGTRAAAGHAVRLPPELLGLRFLNDLLLGFLPEMPEKS